MSRVSSSFVKSNEDKQLGRKLILQLQYMYCVQVFIVVRPSFLYELAKDLSYSLFLQLHLSIGLSSFCIISCLPSSCSSYRFIRIWNELALISSSGCQGHEVANLCLLLKAFFPESEPQDRARAATQLTLNPSYLSRQMVWFGLGSKERKDWMSLVGSWQSETCRYLTGGLEQDILNQHPSQLFAGSQGNVGDNISTSFSMWPSTFLSLPVELAIASLLYLFQFSKGYSKIGYLRIGQISPSLSLVAWFFVGSPQASDSMSLQLACLQGQKSQVACLLS